MAASSVGGSIPPPGCPASPQDLPPGRRIHKEVIDLSADPEPAAAAADADAASTTTTSGFRDIRLRDFVIGDRLGQTRDGGEGFQGCNSRVFRVTLRDNQPAPANPGGNNRNASSSQDNRRPSTTSSPLPRGASHRGTQSGGVSNPGTPRAGRIAADILGVGEQLWRGSFGACLRGDYGGVEREGGEGLFRKGDAGAGTEWALKMALTLRGQDAAQAKREMETEIAMLVGGRIPPHPNIMRGVHSFQDDIGRDLQPTLWAGLGPDVGETLSPRTSFVVMPLFTAGSLQALLNKRRLRCKGPPFLRLLEAMRFLEQMLSAVSHLLAHGVSHNDIKPDNWLLRTDQRTLVLTDFGSCVDSRNPPQPRSPCLPPPSAAAAPRPSSDTGAPAAAVAGAAPNDGGSKVNADPLHPPNPCGAARAVPPAASASAASSVSGRSTGVAAPRATSASSASSRCRSAREALPAAPASSGAAAVQAAQGGGGRGRERPLVGGGFPVSLNERSRLALNELSAFVTARSALGSGSGSGSGCTGAAAAAAAAAAIAATLAQASARKKRPRVNDDSLRAIALRRHTGELLSDVAADDPDKRGRKRSRCCDGQAGDGGQATRRGPAGSQDGAKSCSTPKTSEKLVFPFSKYCVTGTPSVVAPELARAWREETVLDFRRSDVFSVGVCMYRMLRPDSGNIDNGTGLEGKGPLERIEGRFGQQAWPLPLFPENKGGCPYEVSQLCRGLLQADPAQRQDASEGLSLASWFVSRLEDAEKTGVKGVPAPSGSNGAGHQSRRSTGPTTAGCGASGGNRAADGAPGKSSGTNSARESRASMRDPTRTEGPAIAPVHGHHPPWWQGSHATSPTNGFCTSPRKDPVPAPNNGLLDLAWWQGLEAATVDQRHNALAGAGTRANEDCRGNPMLPSGGVGDSGAVKSGGTERGGAAEARRGSVMSEEERRLGEPDELVRSDRISHMRDFFASAAPEDLFEALDTKGWNVAAASADFNDIASGDGRGQNEKSAGGALSAASRVTLLFEGVAEELKGRRREVLSPPRHRRTLSGGSLPTPPPTFGR